VVSRHVVAFDDVRSAESEEHNTNLLQTWSATSSWQLDGEFRLVDALKPADFDSLRMTKVNRVQD
jgi:hypothetical protein